MQKIAGVVILFHPDITEVTRNIKSYIGFVEVMYIIDNTDPNNAALQIQDALTNISGKVIYIRNNQNEGIGKALNKAALLAVENGYNWLLTMDQDSWFKEEQLEQYRINAAKLIAEISSLAVLSPSFKQPVKLNITDITYQEVDATITSGSLIQLNTWKEIGGYNEDFFIDEVDHEYCYRAKQHGYKIIAFENIYLEHALGKETITGYFGFIAKSKRIIHAPFRLYFMVRNYLLVREKYQAIFPSEFKIRNQQLFTTIKNNLLFEGNFFKNFQSIIKAYRDFRNKRNNNNF